MPSPELALELLIARPRASDDLRERVRAVAAQAEPRREHRFAVPPLRRFALVAAATAIAVSCVAAAVYGIANSGGRERGAAKSSAASGGALQPQVPKGVLVNPGVERAAQIPAVPTRLQQYGASLTVQVADRAKLSDATKRAMRYARLLGGYVAYVRYSAPTHGRGAAALVVRVPIDRVQDAVDEYSGLGTILNQDVRILDVTKAVAEQAKEIARLRADIARLERGGVTPDERPRLAAEKARLDYLTKRRSATVRQAQLARVALDLTTKPNAAAARASRFHRTLGNAGGVLLRELELLVYALVVAGPLLLLGLGVIAAGRVRDRRLFERP